MARHDAALAAALGPGGAHIVGIALLEKDRAIETDISANPRHHTHQEGKSQKTNDELRIRIETRDREPVQDPPHQVLGPDDVEQNRHAHGEHRDHHPQAIDIGLAKKSHEKRKWNRHPQRKNEERQGQGETRPHAPANPLHDGRIVGIAAPKIEGEHPAVMLEEHILGPGPGAGKERPVVAMIGLPLLDHRRRHALPQRLARHIVGTGHGEEEHEEKEEDAKDHPHSIDHASNHISEHYWRSLKKVKTAGTRSSTASAPAA